MTANSLLSVDGVSKGFGGVRAVEDCSFSVPPASLTGLIGPNGAGKSTLFNLVSGLYRPDAGSIRLEGQELVGRRPDQIAAMGLGRTFQTPRSFTSLSCLENMLASLPSPGEKLLPALLGSYGAHEKRAKGEARELLDLVGLGHRVGDPADELSGGELRMLEVGRQLIRRPKILLLDEPTAGVAPRLQVRFAELLRSLHAQGLTIIVVEHNLGFLLDLVSEVVVMVNGHVLTVGHPDAIRKDPEVISAYLGRRAGNAA